MNYRKKRELLFKLAEKIEPKYDMTSPDEVIDYMKKTKPFLRIETFTALLLNCKNKIINKYEQKGEITGIKINIKDIVYKILEEDAVNIILIHNHPSGDASPSSEDIKLTTKFKDLLDVLEIKLLDHIIIGKDETFSFKEEGICGL